MSAEPGPNLRGWGALLTTEVILHDLGEHQGRALRARVHRRALRLRAGRLGRWRLEIGRTRPVAIEVTEADGHRYDVAIPTPADPWRRAFRRVLLLAVAGRLLSATRQRLARHPAD